MNHVRNFRDKADNKESKHKGKEDAISNEVKSSRLKTYLTWLLVVIGVFFVVRHNFVTKRETSDQSIVVNGEIYKIGDISVDTKKGEIWFNAKVFKNQGWVQHLVYLEGYKWLKEESAIIAEARLSDLQKAIALLDWKIWDEIWYKKVKSEELGVSIKWDKEEEVTAQELVMTEDKLKIEDFIFLGSPDFDHIALGAPPGVDCRVCPIFSLEEKALKETFIRESGQSGYELNSPFSPPKGTEVTIIIRITDYTQR